MYFLYKIILLSSFISSITICSTERDIVLFIMDHNVYHDDFSYEPMFLSNDVASMRIALSRGVNRNCINAEGNTALHIAALKGQKTLIKDLLRIGVDPNIKNKRMQTYKNIVENQTMFLHGNINHMTAAIRKNVNINCTDEHGNTALHLAAYKRNYDQLKPIIELKVNPSIKNKAGLTCEDILRKNQETGCINITENKKNK